MDNFPHEAWVRLGKALERRRGQLGYGFRHRREFAQGTGLSAKTLSRMERAERESYPDDTIALAEVIYKWEPGSVLAVLRGGEPSPSPGTLGGPPSAPAGPPDLSALPPDLRRTFDRAFEFLDSRIEEVRREERRRGA
jgi:transcriptional regulator with XRE-family HTH domain